MSSVTVTVTGTNPTALVLNSAIEFTDGEFSVGLLDFITYISIVNFIDGKNNAFPMQQPIVSKRNILDTCQLSSGAYKNYDITT